MFLRMHQTSPDGSHRVAMEADKGETVDQARDAARRYCGPGQDADDKPREISDGWQLPTVRPTPTYVFVLSPFTRRALNAELPAADLTNR